MRSMNSGTLQLGGKGVGREGGRNNQRGKGGSHSTAIVPVPINSGKLAE